MNRKVLSDQIPAVRPHNQLFDNSVEEGNEHLLKKKGSRHGQENINQEIL